MAAASASAMPTRRRGLVATLVLALLFHVFSMLYGILLVALLCVTLCGLGLVVLCLATASTRSSRLFVAWLWRNELWINGLVGEKHTERERQQQEQARGLRREASQQGGRMAASSLPLTTSGGSAPLRRSSSTRGREVTKTVMTFSVIYFLLFKGFFNVIFATVPLVLWGVVAINVAPSLAPTPEMVMADDTWGRVFVALATSFFAYQIGVAAASGSVFVSEKIQELLFHRGPPSSSSSEHLSLLADDSLAHGREYSRSHVGHHDMYTVNERDELQRDRDRDATTSGDGSGSSSGAAALRPPPPPPARPPPLPPLGHGLSFDGMRPMPPMPPMHGDPGLSGRAFEPAFQAEPVAREVEFCGIKVTIRADSEESNDRGGRRGRGSGSFRGDIYNRGGGRGGGTGREAFFHPGMARGIIEPPPSSYSTFPAALAHDGPVPEVFARAVLDEDVPRAAVSVPPMASPVFGRSCSNSPRGSHRRGGDGRKSMGRHRRSDSFGSRPAGGGRLGPDVDLKDGAHTRLWEALDLRPSAPALPDPLSVARAFSQYPLSPGVHVDTLHKSWSMDASTTEHAYADDSDAFSGFRKFDLYAAKQRLKEQSRQLKEASKRIKREYKQQVKRAAKARAGEQERYAAEHERYVAEQERFARGQRKQAESMKMASEAQRSQRRSMEAKAERALEQQLRYKSPADEAAGDEEKPSAAAPSPHAEELSVSYREREHDIHARDEYAMDIERAAQEAVEYQRRELEASAPAAAAEAKPFMVARVTSADSGSGRVRGRRSANSMDVLIGTSDTGVDDRDTVSRPRRLSSSRTLHLVNSYQTGVLDPEIQAMYGSISRSDDDLMGLGRYGGLSFPSSPVVITGLDTEPLYRGVQPSPSAGSLGAPSGRDVYDVMSPQASPSNSSFLANSFIEPGPGSGPSYGVLSPTNSVHEADFPTEEFQQVYRSIRYTDDTRVVPSQISSLPHFEDVSGERDKVNFCSYAPPSVFPSKHSFRFAVWAFLLNQRLEMRERAEAADPDAQQLSVNTKLVVRRGAIVHVTLEAPEGFKILNGATQGFAWEGAVASVAYDIECTEHAAFGQVLFKARIVVGTEVAVLRSYLIVSSRKLDPAEREAQLLDSKLEVLEMTFHEVPYPSLELKEFVGSGYFGDAYRARYRGEDVVVKTIRASEFGETNDQILKEFQHEAAVLSMFGHHPCVVPFVGASTDLRYPLSLITKYLPFGSLEDNLKKPDMAANLSTRKRTLMLKDAAAGLLNIHEGGFIHRDVAARNCLVDRDLRVKICDFGLCRRVNAYGGSLMKDSVGPIKYMAPESLQPPHAFSYESDAWMFGVLMWETYTATPPFQGKTPIQAGMAVLQGERLPVPRDLPDGLQALMEACFHDLPAERPSMAMILEQLDRATAPKKAGAAAAAASSSWAAAAKTANNARVAVAAATGSNGHAPPPPPPGLGRHDVPIWV